MTSKDIKHAIIVGMCLLVCAGIAIGGAAVALIWWLV